MQQANHQSDCQNRKLNQSLLSVTKLSQDLAGVLRQSSMNQSWPNWWL